MTVYVLIVFMISSLFAGVAGVLYSYSNYTIQSTNFDYNYSIEILVMVVLGGMGNITGSIIAATAMPTIKINKLHAAINVFASSVILVLC